MARPKLPDSAKKEKLNLTISHEAKEMLELIRIKKSVSISTLVEEYIHKEYRKLQRSGDAPAEQIPGQMQLEEQQ